MLQTVILALVQGITEFLPISSSAHLILVPRLTGWADQGPLIDIAVHVGTLGAVLLYFHRDVAMLLRGALGWLGIARGPDPRQARRLFGYLVVATIPVVILGLALKIFDAIELLRNPALIGWTSLLFGILLYVVDRRAPERQGMDGLTLKSTMLIGLSQALALLPGTSRSGITMTSARALGLGRSEAARFSMLLSIPTILAAGTLALMEIIKRGDGALRGDAALAALLSFGAALASIAFLMRWLEKSDFTPFVIYRCLLGIGLLYWAYFT